jgi:hypothetical protein
MSRILEFDKLLVGELGLTGKRHVSSECRIGKAGVRATFHLAPSRREKGENREKARAFVVVDGIVATLRGCRWQG